MTSLLRSTADPNVTQEAQDLLDFIYDISGKQILSGQHNYPADRADCSGQAAAIAGKYPALWGQDFGFSKDDKDATSHRQATIDEAKVQHAAGAVITLMWHAVRPIEDEPVTFKEGVCGKLTDVEWNDLLTPGTATHIRWERQVDVVAFFLKQLCDANIPVLWRPYHEMNGDWFWWGYRTGAQGYTALWKMLFQRLTIYHDLHNLIWVWNNNAPRGTVLPFPDCFPGHDCVDILATDVYGSDYKQSHYNDLLSLAEGKPIALGEVGGLPTPEILDAQPNWAWFMVWTSHITNANTPEEVRAIYDYPRTLNRPARTD